MERNETNDLAKRVTTLRAEELAILLDALKVWEYKDAIPVESRRIVTVEKGTMSLPDLVALVNFNKEHDIPAKAGVPCPTATVGLKCQKTGLIQETSQKH